MLFRFSLYGFLKNQRYFEPFLLLALTARGLSFFDAGLLIAVREGACIVLEIPSGALADAWGRRACMGVSFVAYLLCFGLLGTAHRFDLMALGMVLYGLGDAFRTGTHKAMIFTWLRRQGREDERTAVYGYTRSWSKIGSAVSSLIAAAWVFTRGDYAAAFTASMLPCLLSLINLAGYPPELEGARGTRPGPREVLTRMRATLRRALHRVGPRRLLAASMGFEGTFGAVKDYLQPVLAAAAVHLVLTDGHDAAARTALVVGPVYALLFFLSAFAGRRAHRLCAWAGGEEPAARLIWRAALFLYLIIALAAWAGAAVPLIGAFIALYMLQNLWRPILVARFDSHGFEDDGATLLSVESQAKRLAVMGLAPLCGALVDAAQGTGPSAYQGLGLLGALVAAAFVFLPVGRAGTEEPSSDPV